MTLADDLKTARAMVGWGSSSVLEALDRAFPNHRNPVNQAKFRATLSALRAANGGHPLAQMTGKPHAQIMTLFERAISAALETPANPIEEVVDDQR